MSQKEKQKISDQISIKPSQKDKSTQLWKSIKETDQEVIQGGTYNLNPGFPGWPLPPLLPF